MHVAMCQAFASAGASTPFFVTFHAFLFIVVLCIAIILATSHSSRLTCYRLRCRYPHLHRTRHVVLYHSLSLSLCELRLQFREAR
jgi:hypothetical protein